MTTPKQPLKVFLCHAHSDKDAVKALYTRLTNDGVDAWLDKENLLPGQDWELEIRKAVREADVVVVCLSKQFNQAGFRQKEVRLALDTAMEKPEGEIFIIPARLDECDTLESLRKWHWVDLFENDGYERLMQALRARANRIGATLKIKRSWSPIVTLHRNIDTPISTKEPISEQVKDSVADSKTQEEIVGQYQQEREKILDNAVKKLKWEKFKINFKLRLQMIWIYRIPILILIVALAIIVPLSTDLLNNAPELTEPLNTTPVETNTLSTPLIPLSKTTEPIQPSRTPTITITPTESFSPTATSLPTEITDAKGVSMVLVPAGEFTMGFSADIAYEFCITISTRIVWYRPPCSKEDYLHEGPVHKVELNNFFMDVYEVSNEEYKKCVADRVCDPPSLNSANRYSHYYDNENFHDYPVLNVTWNMAKTYCEWRGARLPTEAEWEKAARGTDERTHPWGTFNPTDALYNPVFYEDRANINIDTFNQPTLPITSNSKGLSPYKLYNMAGNVAEWVADWYGETYYEASPYENPLGPSSGVYKVIRGGSVITFEARTTARDFRKPSSDESSIGIRCAMDVP